MITLYFRTEVKNSNIHGRGRFAIEPIEPGNLVLHIDGNIYKNENNSYVNHSRNNNLDWDGNKGWIANRFICTGEELTMDYSQWVDITHLSWY